MSKIYDVRQKNTETAFNLLTTDELNSNNLNELIQNGGIEPNAFNNESFPYKNYKKRINKDHPI